MTLKLNTDSDSGPLARIITSVSPKSAGFSFGDDVPRLKKITYHFGCHHTCIVIQLTMMITML